MKKLIVVISLTFIALGACSKEVDQVDECLNNPELCDTNGIHVNDTVCVFKIDTILNITHRDHWERHPHAPFEGILDTPYKTDNTVAIYFRISTEKNNNPFLYCSSKIAIGNTSNYIEVSSWTNNGLQTHEDSIVFTLENGQIPINSFDTYYFETSPPTNSINSCADLNFGSNVTIEIWAKEKICTPQN